MNKLNSVSNSVNNHNNYVNEKLERNRCYAVAMPVFVKIVSMRGLACVGVANSCIIVVELAS